MRRVTLFARPILSITTSSPAVASAEPLKEYSVMTSLIRRWW
jgi:hypothetical protein